jgi:thiol-disulfide isomerase/thioredoxin
MRRSTQEALVGTFNPVSFITCMSNTFSKFSTRRGFTTLAVSVSFMLTGLAVGTANAGEIVKANNDTYKQAAMAKRPIIMHVHADWCPVCAKQNPIIETLMKEPEFKDVIVFKIDYDADKPLVEMLDVKHQSTLIAAKGPVETGRIAGVTDVEKIREFIRKSL